MERRPNALPSVTIAAPAVHAPMLAIYLAAAFAVLVWGGTAVVTKIAVGVLDPLIVGVLRSVFGGLALVPVLLVVRLPVPRGLEQGLLLLLSALCGFVLFPTLYAFGLHHTTASHTGLIMAAQPIFTGSIASLVERRWPGRRWALGCMLALAGEVLLIGFRLNLHEGGSLVGDLIILAAGFSASFGYVTGSRLSRAIGSWATTFWGNIVGGLIMLVPLAWLGPGIAWTEVGWPIWGALGYLALFSSIIGYVAWYWALSRGGIAKIGVVQFGTPVVTVLLAVLILGEPITLPLALSGLVIFAGIWMTQRR
jgi:drug/metabolite transporter (DMT)-like permease